MAVTAVFDRVADWRAARAVVPDTLLAIGVAITIFFPVIVARIHGTLTPQILLLLLVWLNTFARRRTFDRVSLSVMALATAYVAFGVVFARLLAQLESPLFSVSYLRLTVVLPLSICVGWILTRSGRWHIYLWAFLVSGLLSAPPAIAEYVLKINFLRGDKKAFGRNGITRAVVGTEHPLVLGALLAALIPVAAYLMRYSRLRYPSYVLLLAGVWVTNSNGPTIVGLILLVVCVAPPVAHVLLDYRSSLFVVLGGLGIFLTLGSLVLWSSQIHGTTTTEVSNGYRGALYNTLPRLLSEHPLGYGPRGLPRDTYYAYTTTGTTDIARTIDSELVYAATQFGWLAIILFIAIAVLGALAAMRHQAIGLSSLALTMIGLFLALHAWNSLGAFWALGIGACAAVVYGTDDETIWTGLSERSWRSRRPIDSAHLLDFVPGTAPREPSGRNGPMVLTPRRTGLTNDST